MAGARQRETAARQEAGGAEPRNLPTDCPSAVSKTAGTSHGRTSTHAHDYTDEQPDALTSSRASGRRDKPSFRAHPMTPPDERGMATHTGRTSSHAWFVMIQQWASGII